MANALRSAIEQAVAEATGKDFAIQSMVPCGGGCINQACITRGEDGAYFLKYNQAAHAAKMFAAEARCLLAIHDSRAIRTPEPIAHGIAEGTAFLVLEVIDFGASPRDWSAMGKQLAALHRKVNDRHGWAEDNFIGASPQLNAWADDWATFFCDQRLRPQIEWAKQKGMPYSEADMLLDHVSNLLAGHAPEPSLLHGDLWGGNAGHDYAGNPVIYDPASYYGDRETDLAFTKMFGGFPQSFYHGYEHAWPLGEGHEHRRALYNLYHEMNHAILFGGGYHAQAEHSIRLLLQ